MLALVNKTLVSLHSLPSGASPLVDELLYGMCVEIISTTCSEEDDDFTRWCLIRTHYYYEGYCRWDTLVILPSTLIPSASQLPYLQDFTKKASYADYFADMVNGGDLKVVMHPYADILSEPLIQSARLQTVTRGSRICVLEKVPQKEGWIRVALVDGRIGYIKESFLVEYYHTPCTQEEEALRLRLVGTAKQYMGAQYRWGGKSPLGIDCSGLTSMSYMLCGIIIYRDAAIKKGFPVHTIPFSQKSPGDLLYFPGHIAMYIGYNCYIHSTARHGSDGVVINSLNPHHQLYREDLAKNILCVGSIFPFFPYKGS